MCEKSKYFIKTLQTRELAKRVRVVPLRCSESQFFTDGCNLQEIQRKGWNEENTDEYISKGDYYITFASKKQLIKIS